MRGNSEDGETKHTISRRDVRDIGANCFNDAANFVAKNARIRSIARIKRQRLEHVAEIHSGRFHFDQHLTRAARRQFERSKAEGVETAAFASIPNATAGSDRATARRTGDRGPVVEHSELHLATRSRAPRLCEIARSKAMSASVEDGSGGRSMARQREVGMFVQNDAHQSDARRLRHRRRSRIVAGGLSVPRYQVQAQSCRGRSGFERLCKMQQCVQIGRHVGSIDRCIEIPKIDDALR